MAQEWRLRVTPLFQREADGATASFAMPGEPLPADVGGSGREWLGLLRAIISSRLADLPVHAGLAPTYTRVLGRCWAGFWAVVRLDQLLTYSSRQPLPHATGVWGSTSCSASHQSSSDPLRQ